MFAFSFRRSALPDLHRSFLPIVLLALVLPGCTRPKPPVAQAPPPPPAAQPVAQVVPAAREEAEDVRELTILAQKKRIMGRKASLPAVQRVATEIGPLVERALQQPAIQDDLRVLAQTAGMSLPEYKEYWKRKQEADLLLESGGDPNAHSVSDAIGVAQWLASTGRAAGGLRIDAGASRRLTGRISQLQAKLDALRQRPGTWSEPAPEWAAPRRAPKPAAKANALAPPPVKPNSPRAMPPATEVTPPAPAASPQPVNAGESAPASPPASGPPAQAPAPAPEPAAPAPVSTPPAAEPQAPPAPAPPARPVWSRDRWIAYYTDQLRRLEAQRRAVDERYDPAKAIAAQTRYLLRLARRYGTLDWAFQAYHGGEGGVQRTVSYYLGPRYQQYASAEAAIRGVLPHRGGARRGRPMLAFEDLYFGTTPRSHPEAFSYLYGRSDHHRYYWWKILMAERAIDLYRKDPQEFRRQWQSLRPGQRLEVAWYPEVEELSFHSVAELKEGYASGKLVRLPANLKPLGLEAGNVAPLDTENAYQYKGLRPSAMGALLRVAQLYRENGGASAPLRIHSLVQTTGYMQILEARYPPPWVRNPPPDPADLHIDLHATGLCFDLERPASAWNRKVLEYALGILADRQRIYWVDESIFGPRRYHVCPSPDHTRELTRTLQAARPTAAKKRG